MRNTVLIIIILTFVSSCVNKSSEISMSKTIDSLNTILQKRDSRIDTLKSKNQLLETAITKIVSDSNYIYSNFIYKDSTISKNIIPSDVLKYIAIYYPDYRFPLLEWYTYDAKGSKQIIKSILNTTKGNPPWFSSGDFNGDNYIDYVLHVGKGTVPYDGKESYRFTYVILHGSNSGPTEVKSYLSQEWGGQVHVIEEKLVSYNAESIKRQYPKIAKMERIKNSVFLISSHTSINCYYWDDNQYKEVNLFAD